ncbi:hypothetical protein MAPG_00023 [Magnaporthiopsis poae ATCC 64411]|uniref:RecA family profile 1 domain-containing protein n=1 Tax=Magnaporthiopsis poae (strain ATCC 64411 / 73-15) TaxID=644358 RepID=A0A0C4DJW4_MAGP6|nr:hypothetical protein MAPG_00023 [Magnaporthiopsis poae ATCC 64411]
MTDLLRVLPNFRVEQYGPLIPALERNHVTTTDLLTLDAADLGKRTHQPLLEIQRLANAVVQALQADLGVVAPTRTPATTITTTPSLHLRSNPSRLSAAWSTITTLDPELDRALGGGVPVGYLTEVAGESGVGKTQLLLSLLLAVQLPPPRGLGRPAMYVSTEAPLATRRLAQMLASNPLLRVSSSSSSGGDDGGDKPQLPPPPPPPSLDRVLSIATPDLESQDHILTFQVPVEVERRDVGLLVIDSVAANFRAEFDRGRTATNNMAARSAELVRLGAQLRHLARTRNLAVVVANQVADRFGGGGGGGGGGGNTPRSSLADTMTTTPYPPSTPRYASSSSRRGAARLTQESPSRSTSRLPLPSSQQAPPPSSSSASLPPPSSMRETWPCPRPEPTPGGLSHDIPALLLDHQQRWFTGWGDEEDWALGESSSGGAPKTPSLGLVWATQVAARVALIKRPVMLGEEARANDDDGDAGVGGGGTTNRLRTWRRWMKVVFAPHAPESGPGLDGAVEFEISAAGLRGLPPPRPPKGRGRTTKRKRGAEG